ncbi:hypothetical protein ACT4US_23705, partial [Bacillus sp. HC-Mk]
MPFSGPLLLNGIVDASTVYPVLVATGGISGQAQLSLSAGDVLTLKNNAANVIPKMKPNPSSTPQPQPPPPQPPQPQLLQPRPPHPQLLNPPPHPNPQLSHLL